MKPLVVKRKITSRTYAEFCFPLSNILSSAPRLSSRGDRPLKMTFENELDALIQLHLQEHDSARHLIFDLNENSFAQEFIAPSGGISRSSFSEAINNRGLEQLQYVFRELSQQARAALPVDLQHFGEIIAVDGTLIDSALSMHQADYRTKSKKAEGHFGFDVNRGIPTEFWLTEGKAGERPFVDQILSAGQTGVMEEDINLIASSIHCEKLANISSAASKHAQKRTSLRKTLSSRAALFFKMHPHILARQKIGARCRFELLAVKLKK